MLGIIRIIIQILCSIRHLLIESDRGVDHHRCRLCILQLLLEIIDFLAALASTLGPQIMDTLYMRLTDLSEHIGKKRNFMVDHHFLP